MSNDYGHDVVMLRNAHDRLVDVSPAKVPKHLATGQFAFVQFRQMKKSELSPIAQRYGFNTKAPGEDGKTREMTATELAEALHQRDRDLVRPFVPNAKTLDDPRNKILRLQLRDAGLI